ncbi:MAG: thioredoxin family protein [Anaerolineae bacterium]|nr:thioredoxin family protein [Anaerolineae bacterium]
MIVRLWTAFGLIALAALFALLLNLHQRRRATAAARADGGGAGVRSHRPRVLYFRSDTCLSCAAQSRLFEKLDDSLLQLVQKVDVDRERDLADAYKVLTLPTILVIDAEGQVRHINYGLVAPRQLQAQLADL